MASETIKLLLIEPDKINNTQISDLLELLNYEVQICKIEELLQTLENSPDLQLIIISSNCEENELFTNLNQKSKLKQNSETPVIFMVNSVDSEIAKKLIQIGYNNFLSYPIRGSTLKNLKNYMKKPEKKEEQQQIQNEEKSSIIETNIAEQKQQEKKQIEEPVVQEVHIEPEKPKNELIYNTKILLKQCLSSANDNAQDYSTLKANILEICQKIEDDNEYENFFDDFFFDKLVSMMDKKNADILYFQIIELVMLLMNNQKILIKISKLQNKGKIFTEIVNILLGFYEQLHQSQIGIELKATIQFSIKFWQEFNKDQDNSLTQEIQNKLQIKDTIELNEDFKDRMNKLNKVSNEDDFIKKYITFLQNCSSFSHQLHIVCDYFPEILQHFIKTFKQKNTYLNLLTQMVQLLELYLFQTEYELNFDQTIVSEIKLFQPKLDLLMVKKNIKLYKVFAIIMNELLVLPLQTQLQYKALLIIRRFYFLFPELKALLSKPINLVLTNISLFSVETYQVKEAATFLYHLTHSDDEQLKQLLSTNDKLSPLTNSKYYSVKAESFRKEINEVIPMRDLNLQIGFGNQIIIEAENYFAVSCVLPKDNALIVWKFQTFDYDIAFGVYRFFTAEDIGVRELPLAIKDKKVEAIIPLQRTESQKKILSGTLMVQLPGLYKIIFDNSYSFWRSKTLIYSLHILEKIKH